MVDRDRSVESIHAHSFAFSMSAPALINISTISLCPYIDRVRSVESIHTRSPFLCQHQLLSTFQRFPCVHSRLAKISGVHPYLVAFSMSAPALINISTISLCPIVARGNQWSPSILVRLFYVNTSSHQHFNDFCVSIDDRGNQWSTSKIVRLFYGSTSSHQHFNDFLVSIADSRRSVESIQSCPPFPCQHQLLSTFQRFPCVHVSSR